MPTTADRPAARDPLAPPPASAAAPESPLRDGMRMRQPEFHRLYERMPENVRAELIGGVVYLEDPAVMMKKQHGGLGHLVQHWISLYCDAVPDLEPYDGTTVILGEYGEPEPDATLRRPPASHTEEGDFVESPPELVVEVSDATRTRDFGPERRDYERYGVAEYVIVDVRRDRVVWYVRDESDRFVILKPDADGLLKSRVFPGLWLDPGALLERDRKRLRAAVERGIGEAA